LGDIAHAIGYRAKLAKFTVLAAAHTDGIVNGITGEHMIFAFVDIQGVTKNVYTF
jgi:hypothetical protein